MTVINLPAGMARSLDVPGTAHGFFGRRGGHSEGLYASLNCGLGTEDEREKVLRNRALVGAALGQGGNAHVLTPYQIHSAEAVVVDRPWTPGEGPRADGLATRLPGLVLGILTADCAPVLFADPQARVIAVAHAGWKGALGGIIEATIAAMESLGARRESIRAAIGPSISQANYEVGLDFRERFMAGDPSADTHFKAGVDDQHLQFDLTAYVGERLALAGIAGCEQIGGCTYAQEDDYFSFRRTTHRREPDYGRQISAIALTQ